MSEEQENLALLVPESKPKRAPTLYFIIGIKLTKGVLLLLGAVSVYLLAHKDLPDLFDQFLRWMHLDPEGRFFNAIGDRLDTVTPRNMHVVASWMFLYSLFLLVGGTGLAFRAKWAIWLAIGESAFFIPLEIFELLRRHRHEMTNNAPPEWFHHPKTGIFIVLALNVLIVWYLYANRKRLFRHHH
jgi:uncharacterized membrane protein (DUF2068 family)